jgi:hypothetical protein
LEGRKCQYTPFSNKLECFNPVATNSVHNTFTKEPLPKGRQSTVDLLVLISLDQQLFLQTSYINEEVNPTEPFLPLSVP